MQNSWIEWCGKYLFKKVCNYGLNHMGLMRGTMSLFSFVQNLFPEVA